MEDNNLEFPFDFQLKKSSVPIIGIGGGAGRIVNKMQACELTDTDLSMYVWYEQKRNGGTIITE